MKFAMLALAMGTLIAQAPNDGICLGPPDKDGKITYMVCQPTPEGRIKILEVEMAELRAMVKVLTERLAAIEGKSTAAYPGFVGKERRP